MIKASTRRKINYPQNFSLLMLVVVMLTSVGFSGLPASSVKAAPLLSTSTYQSIATDDGWVLESTPTSSQGLKINSAASTLIVGDNFENKQYRSILSFSTSGLPDTAVITSVALKLKRQSIVGGGNPASMFGGFMADVKKGPLGAIRLQPTDFQVAPTATYGPLSYTFASSNGWYSLNLNRAAANINKFKTNGGLTQIRLRFRGDDNANGVANYIKLFSGNAAAGSRPKLVVQYYDSATSTPTQTRTVTSTATFTSTVTTTRTVTSTVTNSPTGTMTHTLTFTPTVTATQTSTETVTGTFTPTSTSTSTETATATLVNTPTETATLTPTATSIETPTATETATPVDTATLTPTPTETDTPAPADTATASDTPSPTGTMTDTLTPTDTIPPTDTEEPSTTPTDTLTPTETATPTDTAEPSFTPTATESPTSTETFTATVSPTILPAVNVALNKPVTFSSGIQTGNEAYKLVDGNTTTRWAASVWPQWVQVDLGAVYLINKTEVMPFNPTTRAYQYLVEVSTDGTNYTTVADRTSNTNIGPATITDLFNPINVRYARLTVTGAFAYTGGFASMYEFRVFTGNVVPPPTATFTPSVTPTPTMTATPTNTAGPSPTATITPFGCGSTVNMALNRTVTVSSVSGTNSAAKAVDGFSGTRWESAQGVDPQWIQLDFGSSASFCRVLLNWEVAYGKNYQIQTSDDATNWTTIYTATNGNGGDDDLPLFGSGRYMRVYGTARGTIYGYSLWELQVFGFGGDVLPTLTPIPTIQSGSVDFGPHVVIFDPSMSNTTIQDRLDLVFSQQQTNQFGDQRDALLFKPGSYSVNASIGFNTQISGLGFSPDDVTINGLVNAEADWFGDNGTQNFWRIAENMQVIPTGGTDRWAVSQAAPFRRMHIAGALQLDPRNHGWSSGGFIADSKVDGQTSSGSQQQYLTRNSQLGSWNGSNWNMVFVGVNGAPAQSFPSPAMTTISQTPLVREKPFLYVDGNGDYFVFVPALQSNSSGTTWYNQTPAGASLPISQFYIVKEGATATDINNALAAGKDLLITPGVYHLDQTINITRADTVVLGMGLATLINDNGVIAMHVDDVDGVKIAGILFDAGTTNTTTLLEVGPTGASVDHSSDPTQLSDVFMRVGGAVAGKVNVALTINSNDVIIDHTWIWRADHGAGIGWTVNTADNGLVVNGNNVTIYGLFVEHFQKYNVLWNGNGGRTYFFQNELPYDVPNLAAYMNGATRGYAAYKVADTVTTHEAWGLGSYCYFNVDPSIIVDRGFEVPNTAGVIFHDILTISLGNNGRIFNVINTTGAITPTNSTTSTVVSYP